MCIEKISAYSAIASCLFSDAVVEDDEYGTEASSNDDPDKDKNPLLVSSCTDFDGIPSPLEGDLEASGLHIGVCEKQTSTHQYNAW